jgi:tRNA threonylcarbamoyladenosine biosynthesis protein TsaB
MNVVAIETATETVGAAVRTARGVQAEFHLSGQRHHVESLAPAIEDLLTQVGLNVRDVQAVAVDIGPGLFTGLRVGVAAAKGLAQAIGCGVVGFTSLDILFRAAADAGHAGLVLAAVDARRGEVFAAVHDLASGAVMVEPARFSPDELVAALQGLGGVPILAVGDGSVRYAESIDGAPGVLGVATGLAFPPPAALMSLAVEHLARGGSTLNPVDVVPLYMREADAVSNFAKITRANSPA